MTRSTTPRPRPATAEQLLDRAEALAIQDIAGSVQRLGDELCAAADLRGRVRRHPFLATGLGALAGFVGGPLILRTVKRMLTATASIPRPAVRRPHNLPGLVLASLRVVRARR